MSPDLQVLAGHTVDDVLSRKEAVSYLRKVGFPIAISTLQGYSSNENSGRGPAFIRRRGRFVGYRRSDLDAWARRETERVE